MLSRLELLLYRDYLNIPTGMMASYSDPMARIFNLIFIPGVSWILFLIYATKPFKSKGIKALLMIGFTAFGIVNGLYAPWVAFSQAWFLLILLVPAVYYVMETFVHRSAIYNIAGHYENLQQKGRAKLARSSTRKFEMLVERKDDEIRKIERRISDMEAQKSGLQTSLARYSATSPTYRMIEKRIYDIERRIDKLEKERRRRTEEKHKLEYKLAEFKSRYGD